MANRSVIIFVFGWFIFVMWGLELGMAGLFMKIAGEWPLGSPGLRLALLWAVTLLRLTALLLMLRWLGFGFRELFAGRFSVRDLEISVLIVLAFLGMEVAYSRTYTPQCLQEFGYFLKISHGSFLVASILFASQYAYYFAEITALNLLYLGGLRLFGDRAAIALPVLLWGFAHSINYIFLQSIQALLLGIYAGLLAFVMYYSALRRNSLKLPVFTWFLNLIL